MALQILLNYLENIDHDIEEEDLFLSQPPLVQACFHGDTDEVRALLYKKEDVNYQVRTKIDQPML